MMIWSFPTAVDQVDHPIIHISRMFCFLNIFKLSLLSNTFPFLWKSAQVILLPKTSISCFCFRLSIYLNTNITIKGLHHFKVLENIMHSQLFEFLHFNNLLSPYQSGFCPCHSTFMASISVWWHQSAYGIKTPHVVFVLLDFSTALNSVDFDLLIGILCSLKFSLSTLSYFNY